MEGRLVSITEVEGIEWDGQPIDLEGHRINPARHVYRVIMENALRGRETWGYLASDENLLDFIDPHLHTHDLIEEAKRCPLVETSQRQHFIQGVTFEITEEGQDTVSVLKTTPVLRFLLYNTSYNIGVASIHAPNFEDAFDKFVC